MTIEEATVKLKQYLDSNTIEDITGNEGVAEAISVAIEVLEQPEQKKGKWIVKDNPGTGWYRVTCSECGEDVTSTIPMIGFFPNAKPLWDYCPYCGAKMEEQG